MHTCRLCLRNDAKRNIFTEGSNTSSKIMSHCKLQIYENDGLPQYMCNKCFDKLESVLQFIQTCEESDKILRKQLNLLLNVKTENIDLKCDPDREDYRLTGFDLLCHDDEESIDKTIKEEYVEKLESFSSNDLSSETLPEKETVLKNYNDDSENYNGRIENNNQSKKNSAELTGVKKSVDKSEVQISIPNDEATDEKRKYSECTSQLCPVCGKSFPRANSLRSHIKIHDGDTFKCEQCSKCFSTKMMMRNHQKIHSKMREFLCTICGKGYTTKKTCKRHMENVHQKLNTVPCKLCNRILSTPRALKEHMKIHTGVKYFACEICNKQFTHKNSLTFHTRVHTGEKPHACKFCDSKFAVHKTLKDHERLHTGEKPYVCPVCNKGFMQGSNMKSHFRNNHKGMELPKTVKYDTFV